MSINPLGLPLLEVGRDVHGRFRKGNSGGPGNPFARKVASLRKTLLDSVSEQELKEMIDILKQQARQGDKAAIKLILQYCVGKPEPPKDPDRMDIDEWDRLRQMRVGHKEYRATTEAMPACLACHTAAYAWPCNVQEDGPLAHTIHYIHKEMQTGAHRSSEASTPGTTRPDSPQPDTMPAQSSPAPAGQSVEPNPPTEPAEPTPAPPSPAEGTAKPDGRRNPAARPRRAGRSSAEPPSPNGRNEREQLKALEQLQRLFQPPQPSGQTEGEPPPG